HIVDPVLIIPYEVKRSKDYITVPGSIKGHNSQGFVIVDLYIDARGSREKYTIAKLMYKKNEDIVADFYLDPYTNKYIGITNDEFLKRIDPVIANYIRDSISIVPVTASTQRSSNIKLYTKLY
ncbi:MAG: hypothetical protein WCF67_04095, partial [Chitinophagaceae bacterium]